VPSSLRPTEDLAGARPVVAPLCALLNLTETIGRHAEEPVREQLPNLTSGQAELLG